MTTVTIGGNDYEVFISLADADEYLAGDVLRADAWEGQTDDMKKRGLVSATRMMLTLPWCDEAPDPAEDQPSPIPEVCAMLAADLLEKPELFADASGNSNIKSVKAGSVDVEFFSPVDGGPPIPKSLWDLLNAAGLVCLGSAGSELDGPIITGTCGERPLWGRYPWDWPIAEQDYD